jgi:hypothetical protein
MTHGRFGKSASTGMILVLLIFGLAGCSSLKGNGSGGTAPAGPAPLYYDGFNDILIPGELKQDRGASSIFQSRGFAAGMMVFKGRVDRESLVAFFRENMAKDNWKLMGSVSAGKTVLLFLKETRWCVMRISEGTWKSVAEISVLPSALDMQGGASTFETLPLPDNPVPSN